MSDPLRTDAPRPPDDMGGLERDERIEDLLLSGLDHYFGGRYEHAINVWTRVLFLDRGHARARAYIERARSALAEQLRESEEVLHHGVAAFDRGESETARRLLNSVVERGGPHEIALALLARLNLLDAAGAGREQPVQSVQMSPHSARSAREQPARPSARRALFAGAALVLIGLASVVGLRWGRIEALIGAAFQRPAEPPVAVARIPEEPLPVPRPSDAFLAQARALALGGHLTDSLHLLDKIRMTDPARPEAERLLAEVQRQLLSTVRVDPRPPEAAASPAQPPSPPPNQE